MKQCFIAFFFFFISASLHAQYAVIGINAGAGILGNSNAPYFPGFGGHAKAGLTLGLMLTDQFGFVTGVDISAFSFGISYDRGTVGDQSLNYLDVPFAFRFVIGTANTHRKMYVYAQPGILFRSLQRAHYKPTSGTTQSHTTYEQNNDMEFKKSVTSVFLQGGLIMKLSRKADLNFGGECSTTTGNAINDENLNGQGSIQGYGANMHLGYLAVQLGLQFHLGDGANRTK